MSDSAAHSNDAMPPAAEPASQPPLEPTVEPVYYTRAGLAWYDLLVITISNRWIWRCPSRRILELYNRHVSGNHLDVGVATGWYLDRCRFPGGQPRLALMDFSPDSLEVAGQRLARYQPEKYLRDVLQPIEFDGPPFDSIGLSYLLHCLPGTMETKQAALDHLLPLLKPSGVLFGTTLLGQGVRHGLAARRLMRFYNRVGIFHNQQDDLAGLERNLAARFPHYEVETVGCAALFWGRT